METKAKIEKYLRDTKREGIEDLILYLEDIGFYDAPASTQFHGAYPGALAEHSLNVCETACSMFTSLIQFDQSVKCPENICQSIILCSLLHDVGKCGQFGKPLYVPNVLKSGELSASKPFERNKELMTLPHEIVSCIEVTKFIDLTEDEQLAIAWHNGLYGAFKYDIQGKETLLYMIIHWADMWASRVLETKERKTE